jgi:hypothetical protein
VIIQTPWFKQPPRPGGHNIKGADVVVVVGAGVRRGVVVIDISQKIPLNPTGHVHY